MESLQDLCDGRIAKAIDAVIEPFCGEDPTEGSLLEMVIRIHIDSAEPEQAPRVELFFYRPDPSFERGDYLAWRAETFGQQIADLLRFYARRKQVVTEIKLELFDTNEKWKNTVEVLLGEITTTST